MRLLCSEIAMEKTLSMEPSQIDAFCDRVCTYLMSYELGIPFQWDVPLPTEGNGGRGSGV